MDDEKPDQPTPPGFWDYVPTPAEAAALEAQAAHRRNYVVPANPADAIHLLLDSVDLARITIPKQRAYLGALALLGVGIAAARAADISYGRVKQWRKESEAFAEVEKQALTYWGQLIQMEAHRRALQGVMEPVFGPLGNGRSGVVGFKNRLSDAILLRLLETADGQQERFRTRTSMELSGPNGGPIPTVGLVAVMEQKLDAMAGRLDGRRADVPALGEAAPAGQTVAGEQPDRVVEGQVEPED